jgi:uncharacterized protein YndB with AHSA1/START domain
MGSKNKKVITVNTTVNVPVEKAWNFWVSPEAIVKWNNASDDWHTTKADNDLREGGIFSFRMEAKDGSMGFDFGGEYTKISKYRQIDTLLGDGRRVSVTFASTGNSTDIVETFEAESENSVELQQKGWQNILDNFKKYAESKK